MTTFEAPEPPAMISDQIAKLDGDGEVVCPACKERHATHFGIFGDEPQLHCQNCGWSRAESWPTPIELLHGWIATGAYRNNSL